MNRREAIYKGLWSTALLPFLPTSNPRVGELPTERTRYCEHCGKEVAWKDAILFEETAHNYLCRTRSYVIAGIVTFHTDGTKCAEERLKVEKLDKPVIHKDYQWEED